MSLKSRLSNSKLSKKLSGSKLGRSLSRSMNGIKGIVAMRQDRWGLRHTRMLGTHVGVNVPLGAGCLVCVCECVCG